MTLSELIESKSRKPLTELLMEGAHLSFNEECYGDDYCENHCPLEELRYEGIRAECPGGCGKYEEHVRDGHRKVYAADLLIGTVLRSGYESQMSRSRPIGMDMRLWTGKTHTTAKRGFALVVRNLALRNALKTY